MASCPITSQQIDGEMIEAVKDFIFFDSKITVDGDCRHEIKMLSPWKKATKNVDSILKSTDITLLTKIHTVKAMFLISSLVWMWELDHKEGWAPKNWCCWIVALENTFESPLYCIEIKPVNPKWNQPWISLEKLMLKLKLQHSGHLMGRADSLEKTVMLRNIEGRRRKGQQRWDGWLDPWLSGHEFEQAPVDGDGQGSPVCHSPRGHKESTWLSDWTTRTNLPKWKIDY